MSDKIMSSIRTVRFSYNRVKGFYRLAHDREGWHWKVMGGAGKEASLQEALRSVYSWVISQTKNKEIS